MHDYLETANHKLTDDEEAKSPVAGGTKSERAEDEDVQEAHSHEEIIGSKSNRFDAGTLYVLRRFTIIRE